MTATPSLRSPEQLLVTILGAEEARDYNSQLIRVFRPNRNAGELPNTTWVASNSVIDGASFVAQFNGRITRGRRGRRATEQMTLDQTSITDLEWLLFYPVVIHLEHRDRVVDIVGREYTVVSASSGDTYLYEHVAILREVQ